MIESKNKLNDERRKKMVAYGKAYRKNNKIKIKERNKKWLENNREYYRKRCAEYWKANGIKHNHKLKVEVLSHYSIFTIKPMCSVPGCLICDIDMLCIDHINNDGSKHRKEVGRARLYGWLKNNDFPLGFQVLCANHNLKKAILRSREVQ